MNELTDEEKVALVRLLIGDVESSPFYPLFQDEDILQFLVIASGSVMDAARYAAISASMMLAGWSTRERTANIEVWNSLSSNYLKALDYLINNSNKQIPNGLMPWGAGISRSEMEQMLCDPDRVRNKLLDTYLCNPECSAPDWVNGRSC